MSDEKLDLLTEIYTDVKYLRKSRDEDRAILDDHVKKDESVNQKFLLPLWEAYQQSLGAEKHESMARGASRFAINMMIAIIGAIATIGAAYAAFKGVR